MERLGGGAPFLSSSATGRIGSSNMVLRVASQLRVLLSTVQYSWCSLFPQARSDTLGSSSDKTLPSITETEGVTEPGAGSKPRRPLLLPNLSPARPRGSLVSLLGEELPPFSALVSSPSLSPSPSPALAGQGQSPSPHGPPRGSAAWKPPQLLIPPLGTFGPPDLSPR